jgi:hypothetical protein
MTRAIPIPGYRIKGGRVVKDERRLSVSQRLKEKGSMKVRPARRGQLR